MTLSYPAPGGSSPDEPGSGITGEPAPMDCASYIPPLEARSARGSPVIESREIEIVSHPVKTRLSLAAFAQGTDLNDAINDLCKIGVTQEQMLIGMLSETQKAYATQGPASPSATLRALLHLVQPTRVETPQGTVCASDPEAWGKILDTHILSDDGIDGGGRHGVNRRATLTDDIANGRAVLIVLAESFSQHRRSVRILLKHGSSRVLTHEFAKDQPQSHRPPEVPS